MSNARDPANVINEILVRIPVAKESLRSKLETIRDDSTYLPPEYKYPAWKKLCDVLESYLHTPPASLWEEEVQHIIQNKAG